MHGCPPGDPRRAAGKSFAAPGEVWRGGAAACRELRESPRPRRAPPEPPGRPAPAGAHIWGNPLPGLPPDLSAGGAPGPGCPRPAAPLGTARWRPRRGPGSPGAAGCPSGAAAPGAGGSRRRHGGDRHGGAAAGQPGP